MTHEFVDILAAQSDAASRGIQSVLATIVHVDGSSYRKAGTQMLIDASGKMTGALSGGCVEKEVMRQAQSVFQNGESRVFKYDGRYRLGCEGSIYILIEPFAPEPELYTRLQKSFSTREAFTMQCAYSKEESSARHYGTSFQFSDREFPFSGFQDSKEIELFTYTFQAVNRLCIFGVEHDARTLSQLAHFLGWEVHILASEQSSVGASDFPHAKKVHYIAPEQIDSTLLEGNTALVVMSHSYAKDLHFLMHILHLDIPYVGLLGPAHRRERMLNDMLEHGVDVMSPLFDRIHGPVGLPIGSVTPEEIALSIMAEITREFRRSETYSLDKKASIAH